MKKNLILSLFSLVVISGCSANTSSKGGLSTTDIFSKKRECASSQKEIETRLEGLGNGTSTVSLEKIFYSPKLNTCMYTVRFMFTVDNVFSVEYNLYDAYTTELIGVEKGCSKGDGCAVSLGLAGVRFREMVKEYE